MTVTDIKDISLKRFLITLDDYYSFPLSLADIKKYGLNLYFEIDTEMLEEIKKHVLYPNALNKSLYLIKAKEYTKQEVFQKLSKSFFPEDIIVSVIDELEKNRFIDDKRYVENYIRCHCEEKSFQAVTNALMIKGIDKDMIDSALNLYLQDNPEKEMEICKKMLERRYLSSKKCTDIETLNKAKMFLARKGFSYSLADSAVKEFFDM